MARQVGGQEGYVMGEGAQRVLGRDAMRINIAIGYAVANIIKTTLGPKGMDKMLVSDLGDIVITNDGATILEEMNVEHPAAKLMVEVAKTQDDEVVAETGISPLTVSGMSHSCFPLVYSCSCRGQRCEYPSARRVNCQGRAVARRNTDVSQGAVVGGCNVSLDHRGSLIVTGERR